MNHWQVLDQLVDFTRRVYRSCGAREILAGLAALFVGLLIVLGIVWRSWDADDLDADIPPEQARVKLADLIRRGYRLDPAPLVEVIAAHEQRGGLRGKGSVWYLARLDPARAARFEADFVAAARQTPGTLGFEPLQDQPLSSDPLRPMGWVGGAPPGSRAWRLDRRTENCVVFFDDRFYLYYNEM